MSWMAFGWVLAGVALAVCGALGTMLMRKGIAPVDDDATAFLRRHREETFAAIRAAARAVVDARAAHRRGKGTAGETELLFAVERTEHALLDAGLEVLEDGLTFEEALIVAQAGKTIGRRGDPRHYRWLKTEFGGALQVRVSGRPGGLAIWDAYEPTAEDRGARDWVRRPLLRFAGSVLTASGKPRGEVVEALP